ncbi:MAG TPA: hypothetical protein PKO07_03595 [Pseudomonadota bacterium]|nr:hypothetical protein [Pseudomonadota bacterium]
MRRYQLKRAGVSAALCVSALTVAMSSAWAQGAAQTGAPDPASVPPTTGMTQIPPPPPYPLVPGGDAAAVATPVPAQVAAAPVPTPPPPAQPSTPPPAPPPYSLPFGLRPIVPVTVLRLDTVFAFYQQNIAAAGQPERYENGFAGVFLPTIGYRFTPSWMGIVRFGMVGNRPPRITGDETGADNCEDTTTTDPTTMQPKTVLTKCGVATSNLFLGGFYSHKFADNFRFSLFFGTTIPVGSGTSAATEPGASLAEAPTGQLARSAMDNVMFAVNDWAMVEGLDLAYIGHRLTVQAEVTFFELFRVRNEAANPDVYKVNFTTGLHIGYFVANWMSLGAELRYQRWLSDPKSVVADEANADKGLPVQGLRQNLSLGIGPRFHIKLPGGKWIRPGIGYEPGLYGVMGNRKYHVLQIDIPILF